MEETTPAVATEPPAAVAEVTSVVASAAQVRSSKLLIGLLSGAAVVVLDFFIALVCLPSIEQTLHASAAQLQLVIAAYAIANGSFLVVGGRLGDVFGRRRLFNIGVICFALASVACAVATTPAMLIVFRVLQGIAGALLQPQVLGLLSINFLADRERVFGMYAAALGLSGICAQLVGGILVGWLSNDVGWRACFLVVVPMCAVALFTTGDAFEGTHNRALRVDVFGALLLGISLGCLSCFLTLGRDQGWPLWGWVLLVISAAAGVVFAGWIATGKSHRFERLIPLGIATRPEVWGALLTIFVFYAGVASFYFVLTLELRLTAQLSPLHAGFVFGWLGACFVVTSMSSRIKTLVGLKWPAAGVSSLATGHIILTWSVVGLTGDAQLLGIGVACLFEGIGLGLLMGPTMAKAVSMFRQDEASLGGGLAITTQQVGNSLGIVAIGFLYFRGAGLADRAIASATLYLVLLLVLLGILFAIDAFAARRVPAVTRPRTARDS